MQGLKAPEPSAEESFTEIVETYQASLLRMCYLMLHDTGLAEDAVQETMIKAYRSLSTFRNESQLKTWLMSIAINTCRDMRRGAWWKHIRCSVTLEEIHRAVPPASDDVIALNMEIAKLPSKLREVVLLYYYQDMTTEQIAGALNVAPSTVCVRLKKAREKLRLAMKGEAFDE
ncbi:MAG: sigma-70 family RNA polymerase sigma factor [Clostridia bacterium]|nr:sigma-70 family RNA polymerase sigma factor [Clostridia bacterium]